jgi:hypothetical protein
MELNLSQIQSLFKLTSAIDRERKTTPHCETERMHFQMEMNGPNGQLLALDMTQYYFVAESHHFALGVTTTVDKADQYADLATAIGESFRLLK